jgi:hypothetical protein
MGLRPTRGNESALLRFIVSKQVTRDFRGVLGEFSASGKVVLPMT